MSEPIKVTVRHLGETRVDVANITPPKRKLLNPLAAAGAFRPVRDQRYIPCTTYIIEHPKGLIVVDTGLDKRVRSHPVLELTAIHNQINKPIQGEGQAVDEVLASMGIQPLDIKYLFLFHLHSDHANGARQLIGAEHIVCSKDELAQGPEPRDLCFRRHRPRTGRQVLRPVRRRHGPAGQAPRPHRRHVRHADPQ